MVNQASSWNELIVAMATPPGVGAIGVIRLSGAGSIELISSMFPSKDLTVEKGNSLHVGVLIKDDIALDEVVLSLFRAPRSYTGEDIVEISCHGSPYIQQQIIEACIVKGARLAKPGEFTLRAFLNGKMDLVQAEAVADLIASGTRAAQETALNQVRGGFSHVLSSLREELIKFSALIELELDFSQEDVEFADRTALHSLLNRIQVTVNELLQSFQLGNVIKNGVSVAIVGKPNAGKSTLLNALLQENRAIVSSIAGTTRDTIEELLNIDGILFRLVDTAGIRNSTDEIEVIGIERTMEKIEKADVVLYMFDVNEESNNELQEMENNLIVKSKSFLLIGNKVDDAAAIESAKNKFNSRNMLFLSAKHQFQLSELKQQLIHKVVSGAVNTENTIVTNARHFQSLQKVEVSIQSIKKGMEQCIPGDLLAIDIRQCLYQLGEITGEITNDDQLDFIFSKFCIGK
jgi:tRNA modification GTPase